MKLITKALLFVSVLALLAPGCSGAMKLMQYINDADNEARIKQSREDEERRAKFNIGPAATSKSAWQYKQEEREAQREARRKKTDEEIERSFAPPPAGMKDLNNTMEAMQ